MKKHKPHAWRLTEARLQRLSLWLALTIAWLVGHVLAHVAPRAAAHLLADHARLARLLLILRALRRELPRRLKAGWFVEMRRLRSRAIFGRALRRALRGSSARDRAKALYAALAAPEKFVAAILRRIKRGFTKLAILRAPLRVIALRAQTCAEADAPNSS